MLYCSALLDNIAIEYSKIDSGLNFQPVNERNFAPVKRSQAKIGAANGGTIERPLGGRSLIG